MSHLTAAPLLTSFGYLTGRELGRCQLVRQEWAHIVARNVATLPLHRFHLLELGAKDKQEEDEEKASLSLAGESERPGTGGSSKRAKVEHASPTLEYHTVCPATEEICPWEPLLSNFHLRIRNKVAAAVEIPRRCRESARQPTLSVRLTTDHEFGKVIEANLLSVPDGDDSGRREQLHAIVHFLADATRSDQVYLSTVHIYRNFSPELLHRVCIAKAGLRCDLLVFRPNNWSCPLGLTIVSSLALLYSLLNQPMDGWNNSTATTPTATRGGLWAQQVEAKYESCCYEYESWPLRTLILQSGHFCRRRLTLTWSDQWDVYYPEEWTDAVMSSPSETLVEMADQTLLSSCNHYPRYERAELERRYSATDWQRFESEQRDGTGYDQFRVAHSGLIVRLVRTGFYGNTWRIMDALAGKATAEEITTDEVPTGESYLETSIVFVTPPT